MDEVRVCVSCSFPSAFSIFVLSVGFIRNTSVFVRPPAVRQFIRNRSDYR